MQRAITADLHLLVTVGERAPSFLGAMSVVSESSDGSAILDVPCGGGITLRRLRNGQRTRYVAVDLAPSMLARARRRVPALSDGQVEFVESDIASRPFQDGEFDLVVCFSGLHCLPDPAGAVVEMARCLRPGGRLVADVALQGGLRRTDVFMAFGRAVGIFGPPASLPDARRWFTSAELAISTERQAGALVYFDCERSVAESIPSDVDTSVKPAGRQSYPIPQQGRGSPPVREMGPDPHHIALKLIHRIKHPQLHDASVA